MESQRPANFAIERAHDGLLWDTADPVEPNSQLPQAVGALNPRCRHVFYLFHHRGVSRRHQDSSRLVVTMNNI